MKLGTRKREKLLRGIYLLYILLFIYSDATKVIEYHKFQQQMIFAMGEGNSIKMISKGIVLLEILIIAFLFTSKNRDKGLKLGTILLVLFTVYLFYLHSYFPILPCGCGKLFDRLDFKVHIIFNIIMVATGILGIILNKKVLNVAIIDANSKKR